MAQPARSRQHAFQELEGSHSEAVSVLSVLYRECQPPGMALLDWHSGLPGPRTCLEDMHSMGECISGCRLWQRNGLRLLLGGSWLGLRLWLVGSWLGLMWRLGVCWLTLRCSLRLWLFLHIIRGCASGLLPLQDIWECPS